MENAHLPENRGNLRSNGGIPELGFKSLAGICIYGLESEGRGEKAGKRRK